MARRHAIIIWLALIVLGNGRDFAAAIEPNEVIPLWPDAKAAPGVTMADASKPERLVDDRRRPFHQVTNVSVPTVAAYLPADDVRTGAGILVCPGGGMQRLAMEHEGAEVAEWLTKHGIAAFVLKYRVPSPSKTGLIDAQRAMGIIRSRFAEFKIDPARLAAVGFSAGGEIVVLLGVHGKERAYPAIDAADRESCRPSHVAPLYPGGIMALGGGTLRSDIADLVDAATPPMFIVHACRDASENSLALAATLKKSGVAFELHIYPEGGHGFGFRDSNLPLAAWKNHYLEFLTADGFLDQPFVSDYAKAFQAAIKATDGAVPRLSADHADATLADGYAVQRRLVAARLAAGDRITGIKASKVFADQQQALGLDAPITGVLFATGRIDAKLGVAVELGDSPPLLETEVGFLIGDGVDLSTRVTPEQARDTVQAIVPVIELPNSFGGRIQGTLTAADLVAINIGSARYIVGEERVSPDILDANTIEVTLTKDGATQYTAKADSVKDGQWANLAKLINGVIDRGRAVRSGDLFISGALGDVKPAESGKYRAEYRGLGAIEFELR